MWPVRLKSRRRVGVKMFSLVYSKTVERTGARIGGTRKITALFALQRVKRPLRIFFRAFFQHNIDILGFRRPETEMCLVWADQFGPDRISARNPALHGGTLHKMCRCAARA